MTATTWRAMRLVVVSMSCGGSAVVAPRAEEVTVVGIEVTPEAVSVAPGEIVAFTGVAHMSDSSTRVASAHWTATGGTITLSGQYTAGTPPGHFRVIAAVPAGPADTSAVTIIPVLLGCTVLPASTVLTPGETQQFTTVGQMSDGTTIAPQVGYSAAGGSIDSSGVFEAGQVTGTYAIQASVVANTVTCSSQVTVEEIETPPGLGEIPELPAGYNLQMIHPGAPVLPSGWSANGMANLTLWLNSHAPHSPSDVLRVTYPAGFPSGSQPSTLWVGLNAVQRVFFTYWIRYNSNFIGHPGSSVNKNMFLFHSTANDYATVARFAGNATTMYFDIILEGMTPAFVWLSEQPGGVQKYVRKNQWHRVSVESIRQTSGNDGVLRMWVDGTLVGELTDCTYPEGFAEFQIAPTWGGIGGESVPAEQYFELDEVQVYLP